MRGNSSFRFRIHKVKFSSLKWLIFMVSLFLINWIFFFGEGETHSQTKPLIQNTDEFIKKVEVPIVLPPVYMGTAYGHTWLVGGNPMSSCRNKCYFGNGPEANAKPLDQLDAVFYESVEALSSAPGSPDSVKIIFHSESTALYPHIQMVFVLNSDIRRSWK